MAEQQLTTKRVPIASLVPDPANARKHGEENLDAIRASLKRFGQAEPLIIQAKTGRVIAGHGRLSAMKQLGWTDCDVIELDVDDLTATALSIALNRTQEVGGEWNEPVLAQLLEQLRDVGALDGVGFTSEQVDELIADLDAQAGGDVEDEGPQPPPVDPVSKLGDLWMLGDHRLLAGDSTKADDIARVMAGEKATLLATDPPYLVDYTGKDRPIHDGKPSGKDWSHVYREIDIKDAVAFYDNVFTAVLHHVRDDAAIYVWHAHMQQPTIAATFEKHGLLLHQILVWNKPTATFGHSYYRWKHEPCAFGWRRGHKPKHGFGQLDSVWDIDWDGKARITTFHPTSKPTRLFEIPMEVHTKPGAIVLEPFSGSGSQIIAAEKLKRRCRAIDLSPAFVDGTILRFQKSTGREALLDGKNYTTVARERGKQVV